MSPSATIDRSTGEPGTETTEQERRIARMAAQRATSLRSWAASMGRESLSPLTTALHRRAGELELIAAVLADDEADALRAPADRSIA